MKYAIIKTLLHFAVLCIFLAIASMQTKRRPIKEIAFFLLLMILDNLIMSSSPIPGFMHGYRTDWYIKTEETILALVFMFLYRNISYKEYGLTTTVSKNSITPIIIVFIVLMLLVNGPLYLKNGFTIPNAETAFYNATMPGIAQELLYRGALLGLLNRGFGKSWRFAGANLGWGAVITSILYGLIHSLQPGDGLSAHFDMIRFLITGGIGFALAWTKERSGSIIPAILGHNFLNFTALF